MSIVSITVPPIGFPPAPAASKLIDLTDVDAGAVGSAVGRFLTEIAPVAGARRFGFMPAAGGLKVADWDVTGEPMPLNPAAVGGVLSVPVEGVATVTPSGVVPVMGGSASFYGLTMPVGLPLESATLDLIWPVLPTDVPAYVLTLLHDQTADLAALVESLLTNNAAGAAGLIASLESGSGFGITFPNADNFPLVLPASGQNFTLTVNPNGSLVFGGFGDDILTDAAAAGGYAISYLLLVMGVSESLPALSIDVGGSGLGGGNGSAALPVDVSDLDTIYHVTSAGMYAGQALKQGDHVIFYNDQADFLIIRLPADFSSEILASIQAGGLVDGAIDSKIDQSLQDGGAIAVELQNYSKSESLFIDSSALPPFLSAVTNPVLRLVLLENRVEIVGKLRKVLQAAQTDVDVLLFSLPLYPVPPVDKFSVYPEFSIESSLSIDVQALVSDLPNTLFINVVKAANSDQIEVRLKGDIDSGQGSLFFSGQIGLGYRV